MLKTSPLFVGTLVGSTLLGTSYVHAVSGDWTYDGGTASSLLWSEPTSWSSNPTVPGTTAGDVITFANNITANRTVTINTTSRTVGQLTIGDSNSSHFFTLAASGGAGLTFNNSGSPATLTSTNGTVGVTGAARDTISAPVTLADNLAVSVAGTYSGNISTGYLALSGPIGESGSAKSITKSGNGALLLTGNNTYTGGFTLNAGTVQVTASTNEVNNSYTGFGTGTLTINGGTIATRSAGSFTTANDSVWNANFALYRGQTGVATWNHQGDVTLGANITPTLPNNGFTVNISGDIGETGGAKSLTVSNANFTLNLSGTNSYTGGTNLSTGTLQFAKTASMSATGTVAVTGGTLIVNAGGTGEWTGGTGAGTIGGLLAGVGGQGNTVTWAGSHAIGIDTTNATGTVTHSDTITNGGTRGIRKLGSGTLALTATNSSYTGSTVIYGGVLEVSKLSNAGQASSIGQSSLLNTNLIIFSGSTLRYTGSGDSTNRIYRIDGGNGSVITFDSSGTGALNFTDTTNPTAAASNQSATIVLSGTNTDANTFAANYGNNGTGVRSLTKDGTGTWVLTGNNTYTGATAVNAGTLLVNNTTGSGTGTGAVTVAGAGTIGGTGSIGGTLTINAGGNLDLTGATLGLNSSNILSLSGASLTLGNLTFQDLVGWNWMNAAPGTYELIDGSFSVDFGSTAYLSEATAYDFGNGKKGYFTSGSLNAVIVVPEPTMLGLLAMGAVGLMRRRR